MPLHLVNLRIRHITDSGIGGGGGRERILQRSPLRPLRRINPLRRPNAPAAHVRQNPVHAAREQLRRTAFGGGGGTQRGQRVAAELGGDQVAADALGGRRRLWFSERAP